MSGRRIIKFDIEPGLTAIETADRPTFLNVGTQRNTVVVWCEATPGKGNVSYLRAAMTGEDAPGGDYIGTTTVPPGIVVHVYQSVVSA